MDEPRVALWLTGIGVLATVVAFLFRDLPDVLRTPTKVLSLGVLALGLVLLVMSADIHPPSSPRATPPSSTASPALPTNAESAGARTAVPDASPTPTGAPVLPYRADWAGGMSGWVGSEDWRVSAGNLVNDGSAYRTSIGVVAPVDMSGASDYAVEADIRLLRLSDEGKISGLASFGVVVRSSSEGDGYGAGYCTSAGIYSCDGSTNRVAVIWPAGGTSENPLGTAPFAPGAGWHRYRVEVRGNVLRLFIDGGSVLSVRDNRYLDGNHAGLWSYRCQIEVRRFSITEL